MAQRQGQRVQRGDAEEHDLRRQRPRHLHAARVGGGAVARRPCAASAATANVATSTTSGQPTPTSTRLAPVMLASASAQGLAALGRRGTCPSRGVDLPGLAAEHEVDGVLGQHGEQRQHRERESGADVDLRRLGGPRQDERGADDRDAVDERGERRCELGVRQAEVAGGAEIGARAALASSGEQELQREPLGGLRHRPGSPGPGPVTRQRIPLHCPLPVQPIRRLRSHPRGPFRPGHVVDQPVLPRLLAR